MTSDSAAWMDLVLWDPQRKCRVDFIEELVRHIEQEPSYMDGYPEGFHPWTFAELQSVRAKNLDLDLNQARALNFQYEKAMEKAMKEGWVHELRYNDGTRTSSSAIGRQILSKADAQALLRHKEARGEPKRIFATRRCHHRIDLDLFTDSAADRATDTIIKIMGNKETGNRFDVTEIKMLDRGHFKAVSTTDRASKVTTKAAAAAPGAAASPWTKKRSSSAHKDGDNSSRKKAAVLGSSAAAVAAAAAASSPAQGRGSGGAMLRDVGRRDYAAKDDDDDDDFDDDDDVLFVDEVAQQQRGKMGVAGAPLGRRTQHRQEHQQELLLPQDRVIEQQRQHIQQLNQQIQQLLQQNRELHDQLRQQQGPGVLQVLRNWLRNGGGG